MRETLMMIRSGPRQGPAPDDEVLPWPGWTPTTRETTAASALAELMRSWRDLDPRWGSGLRVGVVCDGPAPPRPGGGPWARLAVEMAWVWARAAADAAPEHAADTSWTAVRATRSATGVTWPLDQAVHWVSIRAGLAGPPDTARLLVLITGADPADRTVREVTATQAWLGDLRGVGCATVWLCPARASRVACGEVFPGATVHLVDNERPYPAGMLGAAALEALHRAADTGPGPGISTGLGAGLDTVQEQSR